MRRFRVRRKVAHQEKQQSDADEGHDARDAAAAGQVDQEQLQYHDAEHDRSAPPTAPQGQACAEAHEHQRARAPDQGQHGLHELRRGERSETVVDADIVRRAAQQDEVKPDISRDCGADLQPMKQRVMERGLAGEPAQRTGPQHQREAGGQVERIQ